MPTTFQKQIKELCYEKDDRIINYVIYVDGHTGKSMLSEYLTYHEIAFAMPPIKNCEEMMAIAYEASEKHAYLIDIPRAMKKDELWEMYSGIKALKNGYVYDKRSHYRSKRISRPAVIVFSNQYPDFSAMTEGLWRIWRMVCPQDDVNLAHLEQISCDDYYVEECVNNQIVALQLDKRDAKK